VILVGDLNLKHRLEDVHWTARPVQMRRFRELLQSEGLEVETRQALEMACAALPILYTALRTKECRPIETRNSHNGQKFQRWAVFAKAESGELVRLGPPLESEDSARCSYITDGIGVEQNGEEVLGQASQDAAYILKYPGEMDVVDIAECLKKLSGIEVKPHVLKWIAGAIGRVATPPAVYEWLNKVLREDCMVDSFACFHPNAEERFTCWDQYRNKRHENVGSRIDYILIDQALFERCAIRGANLEAHGNHEPDSAAAALAAATLGGISQPSPYIGGGMPALEEEEYYAQFRDEASSGIVYTPPQLSDHVATSLLLRGCSMVSPIALVKDAATQRCQPHRKSKRITDFFTRKPEQPTAEASQPPVKKRASGAA